MALIRTHKIEVPRGTLAAINKFSHDKGNHWQQVDVVELVGGCTLKEKLVKAVKYKGKIVRSVVTLHRIENRIPSHKDSMTRANCVIPVQLSKKGTYLVVEGEEKVLKVGYAYWFNDFREHSLEVEEIGQVSKLAIVSMSKW